jgi:hypothetical protein
MIICPPHEQTLGEVVITPRDDSSAHGESFFPLGALSSIAASELLRDLALLST